MFCFLFASTTSRLCFLIYLFKTKLRKDNFPVQEDFLDLKPPTIASIVHDLDFSSCHLKFGAMFSSPKGPSTPP